MAEMNRICYTRRVYQLMPLLLFLPRLSKGFCVVPTWPRITVTQLSRQRRRPVSALALSSDGSSSNVSNLNPTLQWKGSSHSTSDFVTHVLISKDTSGQTMHQAVNHVVQEKATLNGKNALSALQLLELGSVWYLPASAPKDPSMGTKPIRVPVEQAMELLQEGDYLRVHHHPRRFQTVYDYDWSKNGNETTGTKPGVIVQEDKDKGWLVINKPPRVPVHMTVDNAVENVAACLVATRQQRPYDPPPYVSTPQRLDQNTSGLLVVATSKPFAAYFAKLLANKTSLQLLNNGKDDHDDRMILGGIHKIYKCMVCIQPPSLSFSEQNWSADRAWQELKQWADEGTIIRHYLEPSIRAPKTYVKEPPSNEEDQEAWLESFLRIKEVGPVYPVFGSASSKKLAYGLWDAEDKIDDNSKGFATDPKPHRMPQFCQGVAEIKVELLTGRTHQIRGQLSAMGYALVGDIQYGGAQIFEESEAFKVTSYERLALQCSELEFVDPEIVAVDEDGTKTLRSSKRWNTFKLSGAWWTSLLEQYNGSMTTSSGKLYKSTSTNAQVPPKPHLLPDRVQLSPGNHKYVLLQAYHPLEPDVVHWFVKSASPKECGGGFHGNVAQEPREWIHAAGYDVNVTGGGRINYVPDKRYCIVYSSSNGFGKADHELAASIIRDAMNISVTTQN